MLYDYLNEFTAIARTGSLSKASRELGVSQPALGRHLSALETQLGAALVTRTAQGITPTAEGRYLLGMALDICSIGEEIERHFASLRCGNEQRQLYISGFALLGPVLEAVRQACADVAKAGRPVGMPLYRADNCSGNLAQALTGAQTDIVITMGAGLHREPLLEQLFCRKLFDAPCVAAVEPDSHLAHHSSITLDDLRSVRIARPSGELEGSDLRWEELRSRCLERGFSPLSYTTSFDARPYNGWNLPGCVVLFMAEQIDDEAARRIGKVILPLDDFAYEMYAACRRDDELARTVIDGAARHLSEREKPGEA